MVSNIDSHQEYCGPIVFCLNNSIRVTKVVVIDSGHTVSTPVD